MMSAQTINKVTVYLGGALLLFLVLGSWFPTDCSIIRKALVSCPSKTLPQTPDQIEVARVPHQEATSGTLSFTVPEAAGKERTAISFQFSGDLSTQVATLQVQTETGLEDIALVTHPLLTTLDWPKISQNYPTVLLYQRNSTYQSIADFSTNPPEGTRIAADVPAAKILGLKAGDYTPLDTKLTSLEGFDYVATTASIVESSGIWRTFRVVEDLRNAVPDSAGKLAWFIVAPLHPVNPQPLRVGDVHIDFQQRFIP